MLSYAQYLCSFENLQRSPRFCNPEQPSYCPHNKSPSKVYGKPGPHKSKPHHTSIYATIHDSTHEKNQNDSYHINHGSHNVFSYVGCQNRVRTYVPGAKIQCPTIRRFGSVCQVNFGGRRGSRTLPRAPFDTSHGFQDRCRRQSACPPAMLMGAAHAPTRLSPPFLGYEMCTGSRRTCTGGSHYQLNCSAIRLIGGKRMDSNLRVNRYRTWFTATLLRPLAYLPIGLPCGVKNNLKVCLQHKLIDPRTVCFLW